MIAPLRLFAAPALAAAVMASPAMAGDPLLGQWKRPNGVVVAFTACGGGFCLAPVGTKFAGQNAGRVTASGPGTYKGALTDLETGRTYSGSGTLAGNRLSMSGCVLGILCKSETWVRN